MKNDIESNPGIPPRSKDSVSLSENWYLWSINSFEDATQAETAVVAGPHVIPKNIESLPRWMWIHCLGADQRVKTFMHASPQGWDALIACFVHNNMLRLTIGPMVLASIPVTRHDIRTLHSDEESLIVNGLVAIRNALEVSGLIFLEGIKEHSVLGKCLRNSEELKQNYHILAFGPPCDHHYIDLPETFDEYFGTLGASTRKDIRRTQSRLEKKGDGECVVEKYLRVEDVARFVDDACVVSSTTWQYLKRDGGLRDPQMLRDRFNHTARLGWFRSYLLRVHGKPVAFQLGHVFEGVYYAQEIGYDPSWAKKQVGIYLIVAVIEDLIYNGQTIHFFDFGDTDSLYKQRLSNRSSRESFYYLFPRSVRMSALWIALRISIGVTNLVRRIVSIVGPGRQLLQRFGYSRR
ncbi:MAG: GNAT family N-acetyltransferase [Nitrosomonadales bacterium]|nr:MAG: GNAT family N-acetyltransferase [Nitrosomonadales bacterium]